MTTKLTPRQQAYSIAIDWVRGAYNGSTGDLQGMTPAVQHQVRQHLAKIHELLVNKRHMEGTPLRNIEDME